MSHGTLNKLIEEKKREHVPRLLMEQTLPAAVRIFMDETLAMSFKEKPDYDAVQQTFRDEAAKRNIELDDTYDWKDISKHSVSVESSLPADVQRSADKDSATVTGRRL